MKPKLKSVSHRPRVLTAIALLTVASLANSNTVVFSDDFEDGDVSDWSLVDGAFYDGNFLSDNVFGSLKASDFVYEGSFGLNVSVNDNPFAAVGTNVQAYARQNFNAPVSGTYRIDLWAAGTDCPPTRGCDQTRQYFVGVDFVPLILEFGSLTFKSESLAFHLDAGVHELQLGVTKARSTISPSDAWFDNVVISMDAVTTPVPEASSYAMLLCGGLVLIAWTTKRRRAI